jgi:hypothetical protein
MKAFQITCFLLAFLALSTQGFRHLYIKYFEISDSVLDRFEKKEIETEIENATSVEALLAKYEPARKQEEALNATLKEQEKKTPEDKREVLRTEFRKQHEQEYEQVEKFRQAIREWESRAAEIRELKIFWVFGLAIFLLGGLIYLKSPWLGMAFVLSGVAEMIWWTSPSFQYLGADHEYERLLTNKLGFTMASLVLVLAAWFIAGVARREGRR